MNKIRVIDLLNKIANGEEVPKKIRFEKAIFKYDKERKDYIHNIRDDGFVSETLLFRVMCTHFMEELFNNTVEIIEEEPEIDIQGIDKIRIELDNNGIASKIINQLVQAVKQLDNKINNK